MQKLTAFIFSILLLTLVNVEAQRNGPGRGQSPLTGRGGGSPLGPSNNGSGNITTTNSPSAGYVLTTDGTIYYWGVNTALLTNLPPYALTNFHSVDATFNAGVGFNGPTTNNQIAYFNDDIRQPYGNTAEFGGVYARQFLVASNVTLTGRITNNTTSGGGFWTADSVGFISISSPDDYILLSHPQGGIVSTLDEWTFGLSGVNIATWSTNNSTIRSNFLVGALLSARNLKLTGGQTASSLLRLDSDTNLATVTIGANLSFDGTTLSATGGGGGGGTNFPNINLLVGNTNAILASGVEKAFSISTNADHNVNFSHSFTLESGYKITLIHTNGAATNYSYQLFTNSIQANYIDPNGKTNSSAIVVPYGSVVITEWLWSGTHWYLTKYTGPTTVLKFGTGIWADTNGVNGLDIVPYTRRYTNYASASININCSTDVTANYTNVVAANNTITLLTPVIGTSGSLGLVSDGSARTLAVLSAAPITWMSTNDTANATNILTAANKRSIFAWRVGYGTDGISTNIHCWVKNQTP